MSKPFALSSPLPMPKNALPPFCVAVQIAPASNGALTLATNPAGTGLAEASVIRPRLEVQRYPLAHVALTPRFAKTLATAGEMEDSLLSSTLPANKEPEPSPSRPPLELCELTTIWPCKLVI